MSLVKKSNQKNHLSTETTSSVYPFGLKRTENEANQLDGTDASVSESEETKSTHSIASGKVANVQVGGNVGTPSGAGKPNFSKS